MNKYFYPIFKLPTFYERDYVKEELPLYVKWWLLGKAGRELSEILTGSEFTLLHTVARKFKVFEIKGQTSQEQLQGINLVPMNRPSFTSGGITVTNKENNSLVLNGTKNDSFGNYVTLNFSKILKANTDYTLAIELLDGSVTDIPTIANITIGTATNVNYHYMSITNLTTKGQIKASRLNPSEDVEIKGFYLYYGGSSNPVFTNYEIRVWLVEGNYTSETIPAYEPYCGGIPSPNPDYPQPIKNVTGNANVKIQNRNLLPELWWNGNAKTRTGNGITATINEDNTITLTGTATARSLFYFKAFNLTFKAGTYQYITNAPGVDLRIESTLITDGSIAYANSFNDTPFERTAQESFEITGSVLVIAEGQSTNTTLHLMLQQKNSNTSYVPHQEQNYPFTFAEGQFLADDGELQDNGIYNEFQKIIFDGTENVLTYEVGDDYDGFAIKIKNTYLRNAGDRTSQKYNYFIELGHSPAYVRQPNKATMGTDGYLYVFFEKNVMANTTAVQTWLANNYANNKPLIAIGKVQNPTPIPYNSTQQEQYNAMKEAHTYKDVTYISGESEELPPILDIQYWKERGTEE